MTDKEKLNYLYEMRSELLKTRRAISEELLLVAEEIKECERTVKRTDEYMSAAEYVGIRNRIRAEVMGEETARIREEERQKLLGELQAKYKVDSAEEIIEKVEVFDQHGYETPVRNKPAAVRETVISILKEIDGYATAEQLRHIIETEKGYHYKKQSWLTMISKFAAEDARIGKAGRGKYVYAGE